LAAAFKFVRAAELNYLSTARYFTYDLTIGIYVALALACGLYLLGMFRLPHDSKMDSIGVPRLLFALSFLTLAFYLMPSAFKDSKDHGMKPRGVLSEWTRAFLLPDDPSDWQSNLAIALAEADRDGKAVFLDFTGVG
jgi:thiol:disulfide interchange protein DsbD